MLGNITRQRALRTVANLREEFPESGIELTPFPWPIGYHHSAIENVAPTRLNRMVYRGTD
jgi:hypothetical protein